MSHSSRGPLRLARTIPKGPTRSGLFQRNTKYFSDAVYATVLKTSLSATSVIQSGHVLPDIPHEENCAVLCEESGGSRLRNRDREAEPALGLIPKLAIAVETKRYLLVVYNHLLQCTHNSAPVCE